MKTAISCLVAAALVFAADVAQAQDAEAGQRVFAQCRACHQVGENARNGVGPHLNGLFQRKTGEVAGYTYSEANKKASAEWNDEYFTRYIADPRGVMPGTKMVYAGLKNEKQVKDLIAFLKQHGPDGKKP
ncbi:MAG: cytochrome c family protein [Methylocystis sp.]|jgi:cytochrome c|nr:cytochrome c family protein [Methylocystis sp.]MCA3588983.1 cytochrome c family protein [Methylocystis sp.]MCA3593434.1 cytochrome c family protein [Methylocystis sp.]